MSKDRFQKAFLLLLVVYISYVFVEMISPYLMTLLLAAIFAGMSTPLYKRFTRWFGGRRQLASLVTLLVILLVVVLPLLGFVGIVVAQAIQVTDSIRPWIQEQLSSENSYDELMAKLPWAEQIEPYKAEILTKAGQIVAGLGNFLVGALSGATKGTAFFFFHLFLLLYSMFFFLLDGRKILERILYYMPLEHEDEVRMAERFTGVAKATIKGTLVIGMIQGTLAGAAMAVVGINGAVFWGAVMVVLSVIPGIGTGLVWIPAVIVLLVGGKTGAAIGLAVWCALVVGSVDNFLRPALVGRDVKMHDLLILFSTLGGIMLFGVPGFIIGPIIAALFVTVWDIYGTVFKDMLPAVGSFEGDDPPEPDRDG